MSTGAKPKAVGVDPFEKSLRDFLNSPEGKKHRVKSKLILRVLDMEPSEKRERFLSRFKAHLALHLHQEGMTATSDPAMIDWQSIDWSKVWAWALEVFKLLMTVLPLFM